MLTDTMSTPVLVIDDDPSARRLLEVRLKAMGCEVTGADNGRSGVEVARRDGPALILLDLEMPGMSGLEVLRTLRAEGSEIPVIVISAHGSIEAAVAAMKDGAEDFLPKPFDPKHLEIVVQKALERRALRDAKQVLLDTLAAQGPAIVGDSPPIRAALETARRVAAASTTVLLLGESGTGKEVFAHAIHRWSARRDNPLVIVNCVALSESLLESELFGHEKGAFTGAHQAKKGKFEIAHGGTVFLDEIGDMPLGLQAKLLRVLQDHTFERVGGTKPLRADLRVIAATNRDLDGAVGEGRFREDLFYRLSVVQITLPPLRDRMSDVPGLVARFISKYAAEAKRPVRGISADALAALMAHPWPGNVRELANAIERAVVLCAGHEIRPEDLALGTRRNGATTSRAETAVGEFHGSVRAYKQGLIRAALQQAAGNQTKAAEVLGLQRTYLVKLLRSLEIRDA